jgi:hypothetical protein
VFSLSNRFKTGQELVKVARRDGQRFESATWLHKAQSLPKEEFKAEVERELTGRESEPSELIYFKVYNSDSKGLDLSPDDLESLVEAELLIRGYHWDVLCQSLSDDLPVAGVGVVKGQAEELTGVASSVRQNSQL